MIRVPEEHTNAKSGSVGSAGKRGWSAGMVPDSDA